jgi:hypothetical protein
LLGYLKNAQGGKKITVRFKQGRDQNGIRHNAPEIKFIIIPVGIDQAVQSYCAGFVFYMPFDSLGEKSKIVPPAVNKRCDFIGVKTFAVLRAVYESRPEYLAGKRQIGSVSQGLIGPFRNVIEVDVELKRMPVRGIDIARIPGFFAEEGVHQVFYFGLPVLWADG